MGCIFSRLKRTQLEDDEDEVPKQYSWDKRPKINADDFMIQNRNGETVGRLPGTVNGQQFIIQNCKDCNIYVFDHIASATIDDCVNCKIFLGPVKTSVFVRDCTDCKLVLACQQFRTRDCRKLDVFLSCVTQPIIEATTSIRFGCFQYHYGQLADQFKAAGLSIFNNNWSNIHDFTPVPGEINYTLLPEDAKVEDFLPLPQTAEFAAVAISLAEPRSVVPKTLGARRKTSDESCFVAWFHAEAACKGARQFVEDLREKHPSHRLVRTSEMKLETRHAEKVFVDPTTRSHALQGPLIAMEYCGDGCIQACREAVSRQRSTNANPVHVSSDAERAQQEVEDFYNLVDMQMAV